jgi:hypothetical protein
MSFVSSNCGFVQPNENYMALRVINGADCILDGEPDNAGGLRAQANSMAR